MPSNEEVPRIIPMSAMKQPSKTCVEISSGSLATSFRTFSERKELNSMAEYPACNKVISPVAIRIVEDMMV